MAILRVPDTGTCITSEPAIRRFLHERGIVYDRWPADGLSPDASDGAILAAYAARLEPFMKRGGYRAVDVVSVTRATPNVDAIRDKFLREHTHGEDEVRLFVQGEGLFWFHLERPGEEVFSLLCRTGDLISVPADTKHWFDLGDNPAVRAIRLFTDQAGWAPHYTNSGIDRRYRDHAWQSAAC
jgi:1,2-dihydroxy-3-keto-5-methylthiopentene dioxygenase